MTEALFKGIVESLEARYHYNTILKVTVAHEDYRNLIEHYFNIAASDNDKLRKLNSATKNIINFPAIQINFLEKVLGYKRLQ